MKQWLHTARAFPTMLKVGFADAVAYRAEFLVWVLAYTMPIIMLSLWTAVAREAPVGRFDEQGFRAYFMATLVIRLLSGSWVVWEMNMEVRQGTLQKRLLRPVHPLLSYLAENLAAMPMRLIVATPIAVLCVLWLGLGSFSHDPWQLLLVPVAVLGAFLLSFSAMAAIGTLSLFWESSIAVFDLWLGLYTVFSGYVMPLEFFPPGIAELVRGLPFRSMLAFPVEALLGLMTLRACLFDLLLQWFWIACFSALSYFLWKRGMRSFAAYGG
ncbi:MAG: ABC-2 family transporter protein [Myxococcales bacterium]